MVSQRRSVRDLDLYSKSAEKFLSLRPTCCLPDIGESPKHRYFWISQIIMCLCTFMISLLISTISTIEICMTVGLLETRIADQTAQIEHLGGPHGRVIKDANL